MEVSRHFQRGRTLRDSTLRDTLRYWYVTDNGVDCIHMYPDDHLEPFSAASVEERLLNSIACARSIRKC